MHSLHGPVAFAALAVVLIIAAVTDVRTGKVYNWLTLPAMAAGLVLGMVFAALGPAGLLGGLAASAVALVVGLVGLGLLALAKGIGWGDAKLLGAVGALGAHWHIVANTFVYAVVVAFVMAVVLMLRKGLVRRTASRLFGAALAAGAKVKTSFADSPRIPFAVALCIGGLVAGVELLLNVQTPWQFFPVTP
jgi:prepilin peptidase CpaA